MAKTKTISVRGIQVSVLSQTKDDFISLTDIARHRDAERSDYVLQNWLRNRSTIEFIGLWEQLHNEGFNSIEFDGFKNEAGSNSFSLTPKRWVNATNAIGIFSSSGRYGGTYAHSDIALEFGSWLSPEFKLYLIKEFQRLKEEEQSRSGLEWNVSRTLAKVNYRNHTDAIKDNLIPPQLNKKQTQLVYANEADLLNMALFGKTAAIWRKENASGKGNIRDQTTLEQLVVLTNLKSINALFIRQNMGSPERLEILNQQAIQQIKSLVGHPSMKKLGE